MRRLALVFLLLLASAAAPVDRSADTAAIQALGAAWEDAWNKRDAAGLGAIMAEDATFISVLGPDTPGFGRGGRAAFEAGHAALFRGPMAQSRWTTRQVDVIRYIGPDAAVAHVLWETEGDRVRHVRHEAPRRGLFTWVLERQSGQWKIVASQNTEVMPPLPGQ